MNEGRAGDLQLRALAAHELRTVHRIRAGSSGSGPRCGPPGRRELRPGRRQPVAVILPSGTAQRAAAAQKGRAGDLQLRALAAHELRTVRRIRAGSSGSGPECVRIRHTRGRCIEWRAADGANIERGPRYRLQPGQNRPFPSKKGRGAAPHDRQRRRGALLAKQGE